MIGFLTPAAGIGAGLFSAMNGLAWLPSPVPNPIEGGLLPFYLVVVSLAIALLGPGAFSLDSYLFGRREIVIPPDTIRTRSCNTRRTTDEVRLASRGRTKLPDAVMWRAASSVTVQG